MHSASACAWLQVRMRAEGMRQQAERDRPHDGSWQAPQGDWRSYVPAVRLRSLSCCIWGLPVCGRQMPHSDGRSDVPALHFSALPSHLRAWYPVSALVEACGC